VPAYPGCPGKEAIKCVFVILILAWERGGEKKATALSPRNSAMEDDYG